MTLFEPTLQIDTIERDMRHYQEAVENIAVLNLQDRVHVYQIDALRFEVQKSYDACFIDAAKAQNISFFKLFFAYTDKVIIIDNTNYHGFVEDYGEEIHSRQLRAMVDKIRAFKTYLMSRSDLDVITLDVGDGLMIVKRE